MAQGFEPNLSGERAGDEQVINGSHALVTERAAGVVAKAVTPCLLRCPTPTMENKTSKEAAFVRCFGLPKLCNAQHLRLAEEHCRIHGGSRIHSRRRPAPDETVFVLLRDDSRLKSFADLHILH
jgi:hypothetical protein